MDDEENRWNGKMAETQRRKDAIFFFKKRVSTQAEQNKWQE